MSKGAAARTRTLRRLRSRSVWPIRTVTGMCQGKVKYSSPEKADARAAFLTWLRGVPFRFYPCPLCKGWHLTSKEQRK
jgi:hypothetical protein